MKFKYFTGILIISFLVSSVGTAVVADVSSDDLIWQKCKIWM